MSAMMKPVSIRPIEKRDVEQLLDLMRALADNQGEREYLIVTSAQLRESGFGAHPQWRGLFVEVEGEVAGYATYTQDFHLWSGAPRMSLDDLFVRPSFRSHGLGEKLMQAVFDQATKAGAYVSWTVQTENHRAIAFYERLGASAHVIGKCGWRPGR